MGDEVDQGCGRYREMHGRVTRATVDYVSVPPKFTWQSPASPHSVAVFGDGVSNEVSKVK